MFTRFVKKLVKMRGLVSGHCGGSSGSGHCRGDD